MATSLRVPTFSWATKFYADFRQAIRRAARVNVPELTEESSSDPYMQLESSMAVVGHVLSATLDFVARHLFLPTSLRWQAVDCVLRSVGLKLDPASPAAVELVARLTRRFTADQPLLVPARSRFSTVPGEDSPSVVFESPAEAIGCSRDDQLLAVGYDSSGGTYAAWAALAAPWGAPTTAGDMAYVGHPDLMFDGCDVDLGTASADTVAVWEYHGHTEAAPDAVSWSSPSLTLTLTTLLGAASRAGASVTAYCVPTKESQTVAAAWSGGANKAVFGALGQVTPSTALADYIVSVEWTELPGVSGDNDGLDSTTEDGVAWTLPQTATHRWTPASVDGTEAYWVRWRVVSVGGAPVRPVLGASGVAPGSSPDHYVLVPATQGETVTELLGTSSGAADQAFPLGRSPFIGGSLSAVLVGTDGWTPTEDALAFYASDPTDWSCLVDQLSDGSQQLLFGDGSDHGAIPTTAAEVRATYRIGAADDGNVGAGTVVRNTSGVAYLTDVANPRAAEGWALAEGTTAEDLERVKRTKPAALRAGNRIVTAGDAAALAVDEYETADGSRPVVRAWGVEELYGEKTIGLVVVGAAGSTLSAATLADIGEWANGTETNDEDRLLVANQELTALNYTPRAIDGTITVTVARSSLGVADEVQAILLDVLRPLKERSTGAWMWSPGGGSWGGRVSPTFLAGEVFSRITTQEVLDVVVDTLEGVTPAVTAVLAANELPTLGTWIVNVTVV